MADDPVPQELVGRSADERMLSADVGSLPGSIGRPLALPEGSGRSPLVATGVALGALTLIGGLILAVVGVVELLSGSSIAGVAELWGGILLVASHWGWVHVAAWADDRFADKRGHSARVDRQRWLDSIEPYAHYEVNTQVADDGSITIETMCHRPVPTDSGGFVFSAESVAREVHGPDEPAAAISERAELLRRESAARTGQEHERYRAALESHQLEHLKGQDEQEQRAARRAASEALSDQLNTKLREPPLVE